VHCDGAKTSSTVAMRLATQIKGAVAEHDVLCNQFIPLANEISAMTLSQDCPDPQM
jgi:hypothetical protein